MTSAEVVVDLPTPGDPVRPITRAGGSLEAATNAFVICGTFGEPSSISEISRATLRASPLRRAVDEVVDVDGSAPTDQDAGTRRISASPWPPPPQRAAAPTPPPRRLSSSARVQREAGAGHADRVAERDRAAVWVDPVLVEAELAHATPGPPPRTPR